MDEWYDKMMSYITSTRFNKSVLDVNYKQNVVNESILEVRFGTDTALQLCNSL
jgi:hypothetical protein